jgi:hypothetical protein
MFRFSVIVKKLLKALAMFLGAFNMPASASG